MALPTASDNPFPSLLTTETAAASISTPAAGKQRLFIDTDHLLKYKNSSGTVTGVDAGTSGTGYLGYINVQDQKTLNTNGGTPSAATYNTRVLNTEVNDTNSDCSLASNQMTLTAGTYECVVSAPAYSAGHHKLRLRNVTDSTTVLVGSADYGVTGAQAQSNRSFLSGRFTIAASKALEVQHYIESASGGSLGLGAPTNATEVEVYTIVELRRVS